MILQFGRAPFGLKRSGAPDRFTRKMNLVSMIVVLFRAIFVSFLISEDKDHSNQYSGQEVYYSICYVVNDYSSSIHRLMTMNSATHATPLKTNRMNSMIGFAIMIIPTTAPNIVARRISAFSIALNSNTMWFLSDSAKGENHAFALRKPLLHVEQRMISSGSSRPITPHEGERVIQGGAASAPPSVALLPDEGESDCRVNGGDDLHGQSFQSRGMVLTIPLVEKTCFSGTSPLVLHIC